MVDEILKISVALLMCVLIGHGAFQFADTYFKQKQNESVSTIVDEEKPCPARDLLLKPRECPVYEIRGENGYCIKFYLSQDHFVKWFAEIDWECGEDRL